MESAPFKSKNNHFLLSGRFYINTVPGIYEPETMNGNIQSLPLEVV